MTFITDGYGQILRRDEDDNGNSNPHEMHYYFNGMAVGDVGNNGASNIDYAASIAAHTAASAGTGAFRNGATSGTPSADFDQSYDAINGLTYGNAQSRYTVREGDTLAAIAYALWGDSSYWYMIADANGLFGNETLVAGTQLIIPNKVHNFHNTSDVYRVYDPNEAIGDTSPTAPKPPKDLHGCGVMGQILLVVVAVAVTVASGGNAVLGNLASQAVGLITGIQRRFDWKGLALAWATQGVSNGLEALEVIPNLGSAVANAAANAAASNAISQGIGLATGLQRRFDWTGVAAAGISAGVASWAGPGIGFDPKLRTVRNDLLGTVAGTAGAIAAATTRTLIAGTDFGDNLIAVLPDVLGSTIGNMYKTSIADGATGDDGRMPTTAEQASVHEAVHSAVAAQNSQPETAAIAVANGSNGKAAAPVAAAATATATTASATAAQSPSPNAPPKPLMSRIVETVVVNADRPEVPWYEELGNDVVRFGRFLWGTGKGVVIGTYHMAVDLVTLVADVSPLGAVGARMEEAGEDVPSWVPNSNRANRQIEATINYVGDVVHGRASDPIAIMFGRIDYAYAHYSDDPEGSGEILGEGAIQLASVVAGGRGVIGASRWATNAARAGAVARADEAANAAAAAAARQRAAATAAKPPVTPPLPDLDWSIVSRTGETRIVHINRHATNDLTKEFHGVFDDDPIVMTNRAWNEARTQGIRPTLSGGIDEYVVPMGGRVGWQGGFGGSGGALTSIRIVVRPGTTQIITAHPY